MRTVVVPGGWYADALPSGVIAMTVPHLRVVKTVGSDIAYPAGDSPLFVSITSTPAFKIIGKGHDTFNSWEWSGGTWTPLEEAIGNFSVIYDLLGNHHISKGGPVGTQGWRYVERDGTPAGRLVTGDASYGPLNGLTEYTHIGNNVFVGQGWQTGGVCVFIDGVLRQLHSGQDFAVRAHGEGNAFSIAFYNVAPDGFTSFAYVGTLDELRALPVASAPVTPSPVVVPPVKPPTPEPKPVTREHAELAIQIYNSAPPSKTVEGAFLYTRRLAWELRGEGCGLLIKPDGENITTFQGESFSAARVCYPDGHIYKVMTNVPEGDPTWDDNGMVDPSRYRPAVAVGEYVTIPGAPTPPDDSWPTPTTPIISIDTRRLEAVIATYQSSINALSNGLMDVLARVKALEEKPQSAGVSINGARIALRTENGHLICAEDAGGGEIHSRRTGVGGWETFTVEVQ